MEKVTLEKLNSFTLVEKALDYALIEVYPSYPQAISNTRPKKPETETYKSMISYANELKIYEENIKNHRIEFEKVKKERENIINTVEEFLKECSGLNRKVPVQYRDKVFLKAKNSSENYTDMYCELCELIEIFC